MKKSIALVILLFIMVVMIASCGNAKFPIHFIVDGEIYETISTKGNEKLSLPENPQKDGYIFEGWYLDEGTWERPFTVNSLLNEPLSAEMKVYAKWKKENIDVISPITKPTILVSSATAGASSDAGAN